MLFITCHTQQAINASAAESARGWRQWAKEACQGSAGAGHAFTKIGIDDGEHCTLAGGATGQANGDVVAAMVERAQSERPAACRPGGLGRAVATTSTRRGRRRAQDIQEHCRLGTRLFQPQGDPAAPCRTAHVVHRFAHGLQNQAGQALVLGTHDGFECPSISSPPRLRSASRRISVDKSTELTRIRSTGLKSEKTPLA